MCPEHVNGLVVQRGAPWFPREHVGVYLGHASSSWADQPPFSKPTTETILFDEECATSVSCSPCKTKLPAPRAHLLRFVHLVGEISWSWMGARSHVSRVSRGFLDGARIMDEEHKYSGR